MVALQDWNKALEAKVECTKQVLDSFENVVRWEEFFHKIVINPDKLDIFHIMGKRIVEPEGAHNELTDALVEDSLEN